MVCCQVNQASEAVQKIPVPPHGHDINQFAEHSIGHVKTVLGEYFKNYKGEVSKIRCATVIELAAAAGKQFGAGSWHENCKKWVDCLRLIATPKDREITVYKYKRKRGRDAGAEAEGEPRAIVRKGTNGNYCYKDFS